MVRKPQDAFGDELCVALADATVVEIMLNPDGRLFIERLGHGVAPAGSVTTASAEVVIGSVGHALHSGGRRRASIHLRRTSDKRTPLRGAVAAGGLRTGVHHPPSCLAPHPTDRVRKVEDDDRGPGIYHSYGIDARMNIVISGGTGSGKTNLANAIIAKIVAASPDDRMVILEDTAESQCAAENAVSLHTTDTIDMARLLKSTMRLRPDRIIVGEVRDRAGTPAIPAASRRSIPTRRCQPCAGWNN